MKITIPRHIRKYLIIYIALLLFLFVVIEFIPRVTTIFETTEILEPGDLQITSEAEGYFVKKEAIATADVSGTVTYKVKDGTIVQKGRTVVELQKLERTEGISRKFSELMTRLEGYDGLSKGGKTPISGIFCLSMDGCERDLNPEKLDDLTHEQVSGMQMQQKSLEQNSVLEEEPIYKITSDDRWYLVCWMKKKQAAGYSEGQIVTLELPAGEVSATVRSIDEEGKEYKVIFRSNMYYPDLATSREADFTIVNSDSSGLLLSNRCIIEKHGKEGVYVRNKNGDYRFVQIRVINTDGEMSVVAEQSFYDEKGRKVNTVSVYDEVLRNPSRALKKDLKEEEKKAREEEKAEAEKKAREEEREKRKATEHQTETSELKPTTKATTESAAESSVSDTTKPAGTPTTAATQPSTQAATKSTSKPAGTKGTAQPEGTKNSTQPAGTKGTTQPKTTKSTTKSTAKPPAATTGTGQ